jgi:nucleoside-diphosphate-sugar epimerase
VARVLVLGGTGFVGPFIVEQLLGLGYEVTVFHRGTREPWQAAGAEHVHGEFHRLPEYVAGLSRLLPDVVVDVSPGIGKKGHGVFHFAGIARRAVVLTSMDVYRAMLVLWGVDSVPQAMPVNEQSELRDQPSPDLTPDLEFDNLMVEEAVRARPDFPVTVLRCPFIYGPLDKQRRLQGYVRRMADQRPAIILDKRLARLRLSRGYVENIAAAVVACVSDERASGQTYNVAEPKALTEADWVATVGTAFGWDGRVLIAEPDALPPDLQVPLPHQDLFADTARIRNELDYAEPVSRPAALRQAIEWELTQEQTETPPDYSVEDVALRDLL